MLLVKITFELNKYVKESCEVFSDHNFSFKYFEKEKCFDDKDITKVVRLFNAIHACRVKPLCCWWLILPIHHDAKTRKMTETLAYGYSSESAQRELSNEYQHDRIFKSLCILVRALALKWSNYAYAPRTRIDKDNLSP